MIHLVILAVNRDMASHRAKDWKCRYCNETRSSEHMRAAHPGEIAKFNRAKRDEREQRHANIKRGVWI